MSVTQRVPDRNRVDGQTFCDLLQARAAQDPNRQGFEFLGGGGETVDSLTYGELDRRARAAAVALRQHGAHNDRVLLVLPPGPDYVAALFSCFYAGMIAVPVYPPHSRRNLGRLLDIVAHSAAGLALTSESVLIRMERRNAARDLLGAVHSIAIDRLPEGLEQTWAAPRSAGDDLAILQYTSGSTGRPRGVMVSHANLLSNSEAITRAFALDTASRGVTWLPPYHDMGLVGGILQPVYAGFPTVHMLPATFVQAPIRWLEAISRTRATISAGPDFAYALCAKRISPDQRAGLDLSSWSVACTGSEPIRSETLAQFTAAFAECGFRGSAFRPSYGLAEATLLVSAVGVGSEQRIAHVRAADLQAHGVTFTTADDPDAHPLVSCGRHRPDGTTVRIVDPETLTDCPVGSVGEVWVAGPGVTRGYWRQPEDSDGVFEATVTPGGHGPYLRTGDLGFVDQDELFITGRRKDLIIIRGRNFYPQDIEQVVEQSHAALRPGGGAASTVEVDGQERLLVVHELARHQPMRVLQDIVYAIRRAVAEAFELQTHAVVLIRGSSLPRTSSGKVRRSECRAQWLDGSLQGIVFSSADASDAAPKLVRLLRERIAQSLGIPVAEVDSARPPAELGLDSLVAVELRQLLQAETGADIALEELVDAPSLTALATRALEMPSTSRPQPVAQTHYGPPEGSPHHLSAGQRALWYLHRLAPEDTAYNLARAFRLRGRIDVAALQRAVDSVVRRHSALRTTFREVDGEPVQEVRQQVEVAVQHRDASAWSSDRLAEELAQTAHQPYDLERGPLQRITLFACAGDVHVLLISAHHLVADLWSLAVLGQELGALYEAEIGGRSPQLQGEGSRYGDFVHWQREFLAGPEGDRQWRFWERQLAGLPQALDLPTDRPRPPIQSFAGDALRIGLGNELSQRVKAHRGAHGVTSYTVLMAAFQALLHRHTGQTDLTIGSPSSGRTQAALRGIVGYLTNPVVIRGDLSGDPCFDELLQRVRSTVLAALDHQDYPFPLLAQRLRPAHDPSRSPLFQVMFAFDSVTTGIRDREPPIRLAGLAVEPQSVPQRAVQVDLVLRIEEDADGITTVWEFNTDLFDEGTVSWLAGGFRRLLEDALADPSRRVSRLELLDAESHRLLVEGWASGPRTAQGSGVGECLHQLVDRQAARTPRAVAVVGSAGDRLSYAELRAASNRLARHLRRLGVGPEVRVGVCVARSTDLVVALLGVLKAGGAYVPLDPTYPADRLRYMLADSQAAVVVGDGDLGQSLAGFAVELVRLDADGDAVAIAAESARAPRVPVTAANLAYVIYTSGSTGRPKGVMITHGNLVNFLVGMDHTLGTEAGAWLAVTSVSFDISVLELLWTLARGHAVVIEHEQWPAVSQTPVRTISTTRRMDFSLFYFASDDRAGEDAYRLLVEGARFADAHGFTAIWTPERHFHAFGGPYPNPSVTAAALATITRGVQIRAGSVVLPLHDPVRVAEEWAVVDNLSGGRAGISFASGWHVDDFVLAPDHYQDRRQHTLREIETVQRLWRGDTLARPNGAGREVEVAIHPRPVQAELPTWLTSGGSVDTFEAAGQLGVGVLTHLLGQSIEELGEKIAVYRAVWHAGGRPGSGHVAVMLHTFLGDRQETVREMVREPFTAYLRSALNLITRFVDVLGRDVRAADLTEDDLAVLAAHAFDRYYETSGLLGTPESCLALVDRLKAIGVDEVACLIDFGVDADEVLTSLSHLDEVRRLSNLRPSPTRSSIPGPPRITHLQCTPSQARILAGDERVHPTLRSLKELLVGGEPLPPGLVRELQGLGIARIRNMYGPTETTVWATSQLITENGSAGGLGQPLANTEVYVLDDDLRPVPAGVPGELHIAGLGVGRGYLDRPDLTAERFLPDHLSQRPGARLYRTGDLVRRQPSGALHFLGRRDHQVKVRGHRVELGEVEAVLARHPSVREVVVAAQDTGSETRLVAYVVVAGGAPNPTAYRDFLRERLPEPMLPSAYVVLDRLPMTANGKVDRGALPAADLERGALETAFVAPRDAVETVVAGVVAEELRVERAGVHDNFFELGGSSLAAVSVVSRLRRIFKVDVPLRELVGEPTAAGLARALRRDPAQNARVERAAELLLDVLTRSETRADPSKGVPR